MKSILARWLVFLFGAFLFISACRLGDSVTRSGGSTSTPVKAQQTRTPTPGIVSSVAEGVPLLRPPTAITGPTQVPTPTLDLGPTEEPSPTDLPQPTDIPGPTDTPESAQPTAAPLPTKTPTLSPTIPPTPTREFRFAISNAYCGPNYQTFVVGTVTQGGNTVNGLLVRISTNMGGDPAWNDYVTGTDKTKPGQYTQIIAAHRPLAGLWYLWLVDPTTKNRISDIATIKTDGTRVPDSNTSPGSCQSATINFADQGYTGATATPTVTGTRTVTPTTTPTRTPTPTRTRTATP